MLQWTAASTAVEVYKLVELGSESLSVNTEN